MFFFQKNVHSIRLMDPSGVIRLQRQNAFVKTCKGNQWKSTILYLLEEYTETNDGGDALPNIYIAAGSKLIELCSLQSKEQVLTLAEIELNMVNPDAELLFIATLATENQRA